jgi:histone deacetylase 1/2
MVTRARDGIHLPNPKYAHVATTADITPAPSSVRAALRDPEWLAAMQAEYDALQANGTWTLVPRPAHANVITGKWLFKNKLNADGTLERRKARWVVRGFSQRPGVDFHQTFSPVVKPATIRTVLHLAATRQWPVHQLDVKNAFLHGDLAERVYCHQPAGFKDASRPDHVCLLIKSLYGLKQAPRAWFQRLGSHLRSMGFTAAGSDCSLFIFSHGGQAAYLLVYVDDIILTASTTSLLREVVHKLSQAFAIKDLGALHFFLGVQVRRDSNGFTLSQAQYTEDILERAGMANCKPASTPIEATPKLSAANGHPVDDGSFYRSITGALQYLTLTRPDIAYAVNQACLHMHAPHDVHWTIVKRILRYLRGTIQHGLKISASPSTDLKVYSDADWAGCPDTRRSTSGYCVFLGDSLVSWSSKRQTTVSRSSAEAEYRAVANAAAECCWLRNLLRELHVRIDKATVIYCDNVSAVYLAENPVHHRRTKHVELDIHFVREKVALGQFKVLQIPTRHQFADIMTKGLPTSLFNDFRDSLCIRITEAPTAGGCKRPIPSDTLE